MVKLLNYDSWNNRAAQWDFSLSEKDNLRCPFLYDDLHLTAGQASEAVNNVLGIDELIATEGILRLELEHVVSVL